MTIVPNTFQCFNIYIDRAMELLTDSELRCLLFATRHIMGWQDKIDKRRGVISLSMFADGYTDGSGNRYAGTGLGRNTIIKTTTSLVKFGFLEKVGTATADGQEWRLSNGDIQWQLLEDRKAKKDSRNKSRTQKATNASPRTKPKGSTSDVTSHVARDAAGTSDVTGAGTSDVIESKPYQNHNQSHFVAHRFFVPALLDAVVKQSTKITLLDPDTATYDDWMTFLNREFKIGKSSPTTGYIYSMFKSRAKKPGYKEYNITPPVMLDEVKAWVAFEKRNAPDGKFLIRKPETINAKFTYWREKRMAVDAEKQHRAELESA